MKYKEGDTVIFRDILGVVYKKNSLHKVMILHVADIKQSDDRHIPYQYTVIDIKDLNEFELEDISSINIYDNRCFIIYPEEINDIKSYIAKNPKNLPEEFR